LRCFAVFCRGLKQFFKAPHRSASLPATRKREAVS
jgi:hypothetical protein